MPILAVRSTKLELLCDSSELVRALSLSTHSDDSRTIKMYMVEDEENRRMT